MPGDGPDHWWDNESTPALHTHGRWSFLLRGDSIDDVAFDGAPALRAVRFVVRDQDWRTVATTVVSVTVDHHADGFLMAMDGQTADEAIRLRWVGRLTLQGNELRMTVRATADSTFLRNRIGIIVLHYPDLAGQPLEVTSPSGVCVKTVFPEHISPHQPALDIRALHWATPHLEGSLTFDGDVFEMEDQRNWTDASFKTYSTPLSRPFPVLVRRGDRIDQTVVLTCDRRAEASLPPSVATPIDAGQPAFTTFPEMAVGAATGPEVPSNATASVSAGARPAALLVELDLDAASWRGALTRAATEAAGAPLDVRLITTTPESIQAAVRTLSSYDVIRLGVFHGQTHVSEPQLWSALRAELSARGMSAEPVLGTRAHFTELNRNSERLADPDNAESAITFSVTPQMHDRSRSQLIESISMQRLVAEQAHRLAPSSRIHIGPITLRPRFNAVATSTTVADAHPDITRGYGPQWVPDVNDPRQVSTGIAAWLLGSATALSVPGVASLTYFETAGPRGLRAADGSESYPAATVFDWLRDIQGWQVVAASVTPGQPTVLVARSSAALTVLSANMQSTPGTVLVDLANECTMTEWTRIGGPVCEPAITGRTLTVTVPPGGSIRWRGRTNDRATASATIEPAARQ